MTDSGKSAPEIRFKGFTNAWEQRKLSSLVDFSNGINAPKEKYGKGRKMISVMDILTEEPIEYPNIKNSVEVDDKTNNNYKVECGDLVFVRSSEVVSEVGWAKAYRDEEYALFSGFSIRGKKKSEFDNFFIELSINFKNRIQIESKAGGSTRFNVNQSILNDIAISQPTLEEQTAIGNFFRTLDDTITLHKRKLDGLKKLKRGYLQQMFPQEDERVPRVRFEGFSEPWQELKLGDVAGQTTGGGTPSTSNGDFWGGTIPWLQSSDLAEHDIFKTNVRKHITEKGLDGSAAKLVAANSIAIITRVGVGKLAIVPFEYATSQDFLSLSALNIDTLFGAYALYTKLQKELCQVQGTSIKGVTKDELLNKIISVPAEAKEQIIIGKFLHNLDVQIAAQDTKLEQLRQLKAAYLQKMFM